LASNASWNAALASRWHASGHWLAGWWDVVHLGAQLLALLLTPSTWMRPRRALLARALYLDTAPLLAGFTLMTGLVSMVLIRIVVVTAESYGLTRYALEMVVRVLVLELIPLTAAMYAALRCTLPNGARIAAQQGAGRFDALRAQGTDPLRVMVLPHVVSGVFAVVTLATLSGLVALVLAYLTLYGPTTAALAAYTRTVGQVFAPAVALIFGLKTLGFALAVTLFPAAAAVSRRPRTRQRLAVEWLGVVRMLAMLLLIEVASLVGNYHGL
jgi:phospholipid/cholesterol/gamma-HCH transport system permease protein